MQETRFDSWVGKIPWRRDRPPTLVFLGFPGGWDGKEPTCNAGDLGSISGLGRSPSGGHGNSLQYACLENPMDRGAWRAPVHGITKSRSQLSTARCSVCIFLSVSQFVPSLHMCPLVTIVCFLYLWVCFCFASKFICTFFFFLDSTYKWYHMIFIFFWFASCSWQIWVHPCCCKWHYSILYYGWVIFHCVCVYSIYIHTYTYVYIC